ncbi:sensor histidine kinase [Paenibacillus hexagrammi]|uniref:Sensor histidine kinase n=1 Tax=Paenibacillus hexagrammi TaxID=2908839 RepID=A0ABY3SES1_9BACL|nr:sensor histidine kinase [Paenibacillus sp. YPD9-1]UJF32489.1 sensor histidine kinase [Paenibacillus sp. YPD9-1]
MRRNFGLLRWVDDIPLTYKLLLMYLVCVLLPIVAINFLFLDRLSQNVKERETQNLQISLDRASSSINELIQGGVAISHAISTDRALYEELDHRYADNVEFYEAYNNLLRDKVNHYMPANTQIEQIKVYTNNKTIQSGGNYAVLDEEVMKSEWYQSFIASTEKVFVYAYKEKEAINPEYYSPHLSIITRLNSFDDTRAFTKVLKIDIALNKIYDTLTQEKDYLDLYLVNGSNQIIMSTTSGYQLDNAPWYLNLSPKFQMGQFPHFEHPLGGASFTRGWQVVGFAENDRTASAMKESRDYIFALAGGSTLITSILIYIILRSYNYRVKRLSRHMEKVKTGKFDPLVLHEGRDEIGELVRSFNRMTSKMKMLINDVYKLEIQKKDLELERVRAELNLLQSQMNPHFLFNTLNAILVVCTRNRYTDITEIIKSLSKILRRLISWKEDIVTVREEVSFTDMYLKVEKFRFGDRFDYRFHIDEEAMEYKIPKMSIQPLVENACKHGLQTIKGIGHIEIDVQVLKTSLCIRIADNGKGMEEEELKQLLLNVRSEQQVNEHIGVRNVYRRLQLNYGDQVKFKMESTPGTGTVIIMDIPMRMLDTPFTSRFTN